jgi:DNA-binding MarR family transcriptional regulator
MEKQESSERGWTFLTNHGAVLLAIVAEPDARVRDIAERIGITERTVTGIVRDLAGAGYVTVKKVGRRNVYRVHADRPMRHRAQRQHQVRRLLQLLDRP